MARLLATIIFVLLIQGLLTYALVRGTPVWWQSRWAKGALATLFGAGILSFVLRILGPKLELASLSQFGITLTGATIVLSVVALIAFIPAVLVLRLGRVAKPSDPEEPTQSAQSTKLEQDQDNPANPTRRQIIQWSAGAFPITSLSLGGTGIAQATSTPDIYEIELFFEDLPPALEGFRILHLSDVHIGYTVGLKDLENVLISANPFKPDLTLVTGDLCDDLSAFADTLNILARHSPKYGTFASIGNHEYFRGFSKVLNIYDKSEIPLLVEASHTIKVGDAQLCLAGADDPVALSNATDEFFANTLDSALKDQPSDAFTVLLSHRPRAFVQSVKQGVQLTLSGHTHGGQLGFDSRSAFESLTNEQFLWGHYAKGNHQLYTSSGTGHWFPFRLGCHAEAPVLILRRGKPRLARLTNQNQHAWKDSGLVDQYGRPLTA